jgi:uncharacterized protein (TIGR00297 family)
MTVNEWGSIIGAIALVWAAAPVLLPGRIVLAGGITLAFTAVARAVRGVSRSGALAGAVVSFVLYLCAGPGAFVVLISVFILTSITTRLGYSKKQRLGTAEKRDGRTASQVIANLGPATAAAVLFAFRGEAAFLLALVAALAEAAADTVSSECGQAASATARLITNWKQVPAGTDGGISPIGTLSGTGAALLVGLVAVAVRICSWRWFPIAVGAGVVGMLLDSLLGATLERRRLLDNNRVNLSSNVVAAALSLVAASSYR